jgi:hypothetical protein
MNPSLWRFGVTLALLGSALILPAVSGAQPPVYLTQWGSPGNGDGQFDQPAGAATDAAGNVYVLDPSIHRVRFRQRHLVTQWGS